MAKGKLLLKLEDIMKTQIYSFKITYEDCAKKIWRTAEVSSNYDLARLGYLILATFDTLAYHLFEIRYNKQTYSLDLDDLDMGKDAPLLTKTKLSSLDLTKGSQMKMIYDFGCEQEFDIKLISVSDMATGSSTLYPRIVDGAGKGIIDDMPAFELLKMIKKIDKTGVSKYTYTSPYGTEDDWDYRDFNLNYCNIGLKTAVKDIKAGFERGE